MFMTRLPESETARLTLLLSCLLLLCASCAAWVLTAPPFDFSRFQDSPIPEGDLGWLHGGEQSQVSPRIRSVAEGIGGGNRRERLSRAVLFVGQHFIDDWWHNPEAFGMTADEIFERRILGGCSDYALVQIALFRALGIPSRMVITANVDWISQFRKNGLSLTEGHCFIEVFLEDRWFLFDSTFRYLYADYDPDQRSYPHGEVFCSGGKDFWDMGIRDIQGYDSALRDLALRHDGTFKEPDYPRHPL